MSEIRLVGDILSDVANGASLGPVTKVAGPLGLGGEGAPYGTDGAGWTCCRSRRFSPSMILA